MNSHDATGTAPRWKLWAKLAISALLLAALLIRIDFGDVLRWLRSLPPATAVAALAVAVFGACVAAGKWRLLLPGSPFGQLLKITFVRHFYSLVLYGQVSGDLARVYLLGREGSGRYAEVSASVLFDRITGFLGLMIVTAVALVLSPVAVGASVGAGVAALVAVILLGLWLLQRETVFERLSMLLRSGATRLGLSERLVESSGRFLGVLQAYSRNRSVAMLSIAVGAVYQLVCVVMVAVLAAGLDIEVPFVDLCWVFGAISVLLFLPISIGGLGVREGGFVGLLTALGVAGDRAMALSLACFAIEVVMGLAGLVLHLRLGGRTSQSPPIGGEG